MYNKNILAPLSTFVPKVCLCASRAPRDRAARTIYSSVIIGRVHLILVLFSAGPLDFVNSGAIYRLAKDGARERAEGGV